MTVRGLGWVPVVLVGLLPGPSRADAPFEREPIDYLSAPVQDPVARLQERLDRGEAKLTYDKSRGGYLASVLEALGVPTSSQALVFSKTSFQAPRISPRTPRAIYFADDVYVGWCRGGDVVEISAVDPKQGAVFYLLDQDTSIAPRFERQTHGCLSCHASPKTKDVPGHLVRSVFPDPGGMPVYNAGTFLIGHESPMDERWGGWYVTGTHGDARHMGNAVVRDRKDPEGLDREAGANVTDLTDRFDTRPYLEPHSDIVALMVLEHQTQLHNLITATNYQARLAQHYEKGINEALGRPADAMSPSTARRYEAPAEELVKYLLFAEEAPLPAPIQGTSGFVSEFAAQGPRDAKGRSLRDFDLTTRLFKYPCSYLIYSEAFDALPDPARAYVYRRLEEILTGRDQSPAFARLTPDDRRAILEILRDTKPGPPASWTVPPDR
jgi:hypothetical protein